MATRKPGKPKNYSRTWRPKSKASEGPKRSIKLTAAQKRTQAKRAGAEGPKKTYRQSRTSYTTGIAGSQMMGPKSNSSGVWKQRPDQAKKKQQAKNSRVINSKGTGRGRKK